MKRVGFVFLLIISLLIACEEDNHDATANTQKEPGVDKKEQVTDSRNQEVYPLSGIVSEGGNIDQRPIGVMINNHRSARPQSGLSDADIVFEILAEGTITRFLAIYQSNLPEVVGPVRSAREYYADIANGYNSIYVYHGAANFVNDIIASKGIDHLNGSIYDNDGHLFKRESFRKAPHNSYLQLPAVNEVASEKGFEISNSIEPLEFLTDTDVEGLSGDAANNIEVIYSSNPANVVEYMYQEGKGTYTRSSDGEQTVELQTDQPISVENIFILETNHEVIDDAGRRAVDLTSGGSAYLIQHGQYQKVEWENRDGRIVPVKDGKELGLIPGMTWVNVVPSGDPGMEQAVTISGQ